MTRRTKRIAVGIGLVVALIAGFAWYHHTDGQVLAPLRGWRRYEVSGSSMNPTMSDGDVFYCDPLSRDDVADLAVGTIVVVEFDGLLQVKRVVAQAGNTVEGRGGVLLVDGTPTLDDLTAAGQLDDFGPVEVPEGHVFVLGDNFTASRDSRSRGASPFIEVICEVHR